MNDYYAVRFRIMPPSETACDLLADELADVGYETFASSDGFDVLTAYVPAKAYSAEAALAATAALPPGVTATADAEFIEGRDWNAEWEKHYFSPIVVDGRVAVCSTFHKDIPPADITIYINPKMAFGTGHHATTVLMMRSLLNGGDIVGARVVDMGTGTGILAILAFKLGAAEVTAIEIDEFAVENTAENIKLNIGNSDSIRLIHGDATALDGYGDFADIFLANINRNIITADISRYADAMKAGARLTVSGFYVEDRAAVEEAAVAVGLRLKSVADLDRWSSMTFTKGDA